MERGGGSGERSRIVAKSRSSSGCLSLKGESNGVSRTVSSSGTRRSFRSKSEKKRSRMIVSDSESSDEFMKPPPRRSVDCKTLQAKGSSEERFARKRDMAEPDHNVFVRRNHEASGSLAKLSSLDVFEFDEYDGFDSAASMRNDNDSVGVSGRSSFGPSRVDSSVGGSGSGRNGPFDRRKNSYVNGMSSMSSEEDDTSESDSGEPIRVQGRNGVLKVKVKNKMSGEGGVKSFEEVKYLEPKCCSKVKANNKISTLSTSISHQEAEISKKPLSSGKAQKREFVKPTPRKSNAVDNNSDSEGSDMSRKFKRRKSECRKPKKDVNTNSVVKPTMREERKGRRGAGTEKQRLRERIKGMLTDAGWTIEYRPRRNQSYLDAVYINPSGTAYWSIIKAYDALLKQINDDEIDARSKKDAAVVASVSEEIVNNLARKNKKVQTKVTKRWKKDSSGSDCEKESDGADSDTREQRRSSFVKSTKKGRNQTDLDDLPSKSKSSSYYNDVRPSSGSNSHYLHGRKSRKMGRCTLLVRSSKDEKNPAIDGFNPYSGKRTLLSWLIECGVVQLRQKVQYMNSRCTKVMLEGWITREGIHCDCCSKILTLSRFEVHAGSKLCQPFQNIYLESGVSLLQCQLRAWNLQKDCKSLGFHHVDTDGDDPNDDACGICGDGGDLICCDGCPSTYHQTCLGVQVLPPGDWHCPNCTCKFCDAAVESGVEDGDVLPLLSCNMCERRYHQSCMSELDAEVKSFSSASSFCGSKCLELFEKLQKYLGVKNEIEGGYSWSLIHRVDTDSDSNSQFSAQRIEINSKLAVGLAIMDECFLPIVDRRSGVNLIRNVLYNCGSNFNRINYAGFYTAILERGDEIISAASLRFHGMQLAEMPFIGTRHIYRRQGMCRRLFDAIESAMRSLKIEKLVIPAIPDFLHAWTGNFGFTPLDDSVRKEMRSLNTLVFPGIDVLQKPLLNNIAAAAVAVLHDNNPLNSEIEPVNQSEFDADPADCYKNIVAPDEETLHISVETVTISRPEDDELMKYFPGQTRIKSGTKRVSGYGYPCEDTGSSSCDDVIADPNICLDAQEIQQASADYKACAIFRVENNLSSGRGSSDLSSISQEAKSEHNSINGNTILGAAATTTLSITKLADSNLISYCKDEDSHQKDDAFADGFLL